MFIFHNFQIIQQLLCSLQWVPKPDLLPSIFVDNPPTRSRFENHREVDNPKYPEIPDILCKPKVLGITRYFGYSHT